MDHGLFDASLAHFAWSEKPLHFQSWEEVHPAWIRTFELLAGSLSSSLIFQALSDVTYICLPSEVDFWNYWNISHDVCDTKNYTGSVNFAGCIFHPRDPPFVALLKEAKHRALNWTYINLTWRPTSLILLTSLLLSLRTRSKRHQAHWRQPSRAVTRKGSFSLNQVNLA